MTAMRDTCNAVDAALVCCDMGCCSQRTIAVVVHWQHAACRTSWPTSTVCALYVMLWEALLGDSTFVSTDHLLGCIRFCNVQMLTKEPECSASRCNVFCMSAIRH